jgi:cytoskeleton protein RodZ
MATTPFGEHLRREREMRGVSLEEISTATRISVHFLEALESEKWDKLPGGIFNRGFIRAVAHFLGLDEESLIAEYALSTNDKPAVAVWAKPPAKSPRWLLPLLLLLLLVVLAVAGWLGYRHFGSRLKFWHRPAKTSVTQPAGMQPPRSTPQPAARSTAAANPAQEKSDVLELKVEAGKSTRLRVVADGITAFNGRFVAGQSQVFQANDRFEVTSSEASALVLELNSQIQPPLGPPGQPGSVTLSRKDLKPSPGEKD